MNLNSKYFEAISIKNSKKSAASQEDEKPCAYRGCDKSGRYRAPIRGYDPRACIYFCLDHIREYNKNFNYLDDLSPEEKENFLHSYNFNDAKYYKINQPKASENFANFRSGSAVYQKRVGNNLKISKEAIKVSRKLSNAELAAFAILDLPLDASEEIIVTKYKKLVKVYHPDTNGGNRSCEARFNEIIKAYKTLKAKGFC